MLVKKKYILHQIQIQGDHLNVSEFKRKRKNQYFRIVHGGPLGAVLK